MEAATALALVGLVDALGVDPHGSLVLAGFLDEVAHVGTGVLVLSAIGARCGHRALVFLAGTVLIDVDHLPYLAGFGALTEGSARPYTHSLLSIILLVLAATAVDARPRRLLALLALGLVVHLSRDFATGTGGVPLLWPLTRQGLTVPYGVYFVALCVLAVASLVGRRAEPRLSPSA